MDIHGNLLIIAAVALFLHSLSLAMGVEGVLGKNFFPSRAQALEEEARLNSSNHIILLL